MADVAIHWTEEEYNAYLKGLKKGARKSAQFGFTDVKDADHYIWKPEAEKKRQKYGNRKVTIDGMKFDSQHEADVYFGTLLPSWKCGTYKLLARQVPFDLPGGIKYIADFLTVSMDGHVSVIDAKSAATRKNRVYINKKKQMKAIWGIEIREV